MLSYTGQPISEDDFVAWAVGDRGHTVRIGQVQQVMPNGKLRCKMLTDGRGNIEAHRVIHTTEPDWLRAVGKTYPHTYKVPDPNSRWGGSWEREDCLVHSFDGDNYWILFKGIPYMLDKRPLVVLRSVL